jgi:hypothetical protein
MHNLGAQPSHADNPKSSTLLKSRNLFWTIKKGRGRKPGHGSYGTLETTSERDWKSRKFQAIVADVAVAEAASNQENKPDQQRT